MRKIFSIMLIIFLVLVIIGSQFYSFEQKKELHGMIDDRDKSIESLIYALNESNQQRITLSSEKDVGVIYGTLTLAFGNCMPMKCETMPCPDTCPTKKVNRNISIMEVIKSERIEGVYLSDTFEFNLIHTFISDPDGLFIAVLPVGNYSLFVEDEGKMYCNQFDQNGYSCAFEIKKNEATRYDVQIDHAAW